MNIKWFIRSALVGTLGILLFGCGGGGGSSVDDSRIVSGVAQAGLIKNGTVRVYGINADGTQTLLKETTTDANGKYQVNIGKFSGAIVVKVFGNYIDEATGKSITVPEAQPFQAALPASGTNSPVISIPVTPLTDIAVRRAEASGGIAANIEASNQAVSEIFGVDITKNLPVPPTSDDMKSTTTTPEQKKYTTVLTALSQYVANSSSTPAAPSFDDLQNSLAQISSAISTSGGTSTIASPQVAMSIQQAASDIVTNPNTATVITAAGSVGQAIINTLSTVGTTSGAQIKSFKIRTTGTYTGLIYGVQFSLGVPSGVSLRADATTGATANGAVVASGQASSDQTYTLAKFASSNLKVEIANAAGFPSGEVARIYVDVAAGVTVPAASAFTPITGVKLVDGKGVAITGVGVEVF